MNSVSGRTELTLEDYSAILKRRWLWVLAPVVVLAGLASAFSLRAEPQYTATAAVLLSDSAAQEALDPSSTNTGLLTRRMENEVNSARSDATESLVEDELGFLPEDEVSITGFDGADVLEFTAVAPSPEEAATWANTWARAYVTTKQTEAAQSITGAVDQLEDRLALLQAERAELRAPIDELADRLVLTSDPDRRAQLELEIERLRDEIAPALQLVDVQIEQVVTSVGDLELSGEVAGAGTARVLQVASPPEAASGAPLWRTVLLGLVAGSVLGIAVALARESFDKTIKSADDIVALTGLPVLGSVPKPGRRHDAELALASRDQPGSTVADGYYRITSAFQFSLVGKNVQSILVTSANQSEGKTTTSANLSYALSTLDKRVALVDVDFRRPRLHQALDLEMEPGFSNHLIDATPLEELASHIDDERMLAVVTCGGLPPNPAEFVSVPEFGAAIESLEEAADLVVLDGPPLLPVADSLSLARHVDAVVLTVMAGETEKQHLQKAVASVTQVGASVLGCVLIGVKDADLYGAYQYYAADQENGRGKRRRKKNERRQESSVGANPRAEAAASLDAESADLEQAMPVVEERPVPVPLPPARPSADPIEVAGVRIPTRPVPPVIDLDSEDAAARQARAEVSRRDIPEPPA